MCEEDKKVWLWNVNLAWELFSSGVFQYRLSLNTKEEHKRHAFYKHVIFDMVTAVEAFCNSLLAKEGLSNTKLKNESIINKLQALGIESIDERYKDSKKVRDKFIVHHIREDQLYFTKITQEIALNSIESTQDIIAGISYNKGDIFPYWITGLNFTNPNHSHDICLSNDYQFWSKLKQLNISRVVNDMVLPSGDIIVPKDRKVYESLYKEIWAQLKKGNFTLTVLDDLKKIELYRKAPLPTYKWWE
jgi:hypothetical protein